jgi:hypothetical protein
MATKLRIRCGSIELEYEGELAFEKAYVVELLKNVSDLNLGLSEPSVGVRSDGVDEGASKNAVHVSGVSDIAQKLDAKTGPELVIASCASLHFTNQKVDFTRKDVTSTMREAKHFFKSSYANNLSTMLQGLVKNGTLRSLGGERYALSHTAIVDLTKRLA